MYLLGWGQFFKDFAREVTIDMMYAQLLLQTKWSGVKTLIGPIRNLFMVTTLRFAKF